MRGRTSFTNFTEFRNEVLRHRAGPLISPVDEIVDDLFRNETEDESEPLWDEADE